MSSHCRMMLGAWAEMAGAAAVHAKDGGGFEVQSARGAPALIKGEKFAPGAWIAVPAGASVTLIDRTGKTIATRECVGEYAGPVERCPAPGAKGATRTNVVPS